jgi:hypothetical protein
MTIILVGRLDDIDEKPRKMMELLSMLGLLLLLIAFADVHRLQHYMMPIK